MSTRAILNRDVSDSTLESLSAFCQPIGFFTEGRTYNQLANHVDVFMFQMGNELVLDTHLTAEFYSMLDSWGVKYTLGKTKVEATNESVVAYNVAANDCLAIHNFMLTDAVVKEKISGLQLVHCKQAFSRCSTLLLKNSAITSDAGIAKALSKSGVDVLLVSQKEIELKGYRCGCFGGCCGLMENVVHINGSLKHHSQGKEIRQFIEKHGFELNELTDKPLEDIGSIIFIN